jgi:hypothetical protein
MKNASTIWEAIDSQGARVYWCCSRQHYWWKDATAAAKCCNGWTPVVIPGLYSRCGPAYWGRWYEPVISGSNRIVIPSFLTDEISRLNAIWSEDPLKRRTWDWTNSSEQTQ